MKIGVIMFPTDKAIQPMELARACEERGFESLWFPEHSHIPTSRETPWGGNPNLGPLPEEYWRTHDQFVALTACAAVTKKLRLGTGITLVAQRDPIWLAKEVASLDMISGGRFDFGIGYGWCVEEMRNHGLDYKKRRGILRENILLMKELWTKDEAAFSGKTREFEQSWAWPKPTQKPHPPIIMGGAAGPKTAAHIAEFCDGWMPLGGLYDFEGGMIKIQEACQEAGRDPASVDVGMFFAMAPEADQIKALPGMGVSRAILPLPPEPADKVLPILDEYAKFL
ncbi:MAG: LLM class F420-dependent oxidoreductase [Gammaproteobacteria bacterium]